MSYAGVMGIIFLLIIVLLGLFYQFALRYILTYRFKEKGLAAVYFGFLYVMYIKYEKIDNVRIIPLADTLWRGGLRTLRAGNRLRGHVVAFRREKGLMKQFYLTPDDPQIFAEELKSRIKKASKSGTNGF